MTSLSPDGSPSPGGHEITIPWGPEHAMRRKRRRPGTTRASFYSRRDGLIDREAIKMARAAGTDQTGLRTIGAHMYRIPRHIAAAAAIGMAEHRLVVGAVRCPIVAGGIETGGEGAPVGVRARENVMLVGHVAEAFDQFALLGQHIGFLDIVAVALIVAMQ